MPALPAIAIGVTVAATAASVAASAANARAQQQSANYTAKMQGYNGDILQQQADEKSQQVLQEGEAIAGRAKAIAGANGLGDSGSVQDVTYSNALANTRDALAAKYSGTIDAYNARNSSALSSATESNAITQGGYAMAGSLLSGASSVYKYKSTYTARDNPPTF